MHDLEKRLSEERFTMALLRIYCLAGSTSLVTILGKLRSRKSKEYTDDAMNRLSGVRTVFIAAQVGA